VASATRRNLPVCPAILAQSMLKLPSVTVRAAILLGIFWGMAGPGLAATTAPLSIRVIVQRPVLVSGAHTHGSAASLGTAEVVDAAGRPLAVRVQFAPASAPEGMRFVTVLADGGPLAAPSEEEIALSAVH
jgi:hypothetical protein